MSRNNRSKVRGPNSALTEFLRVEGITDAFREKKENELVFKRRRRTPPKSRAKSPKHEEDASIQEISDFDSDTKTPEIKQDEDFSSLVALDGDFDEPPQLTLSEDEADATSAAQETCADCGNPFTLTVYSRFSDDLKGYICEDCNDILKQREKTLQKNQANARKRRRKKAKALLDKKEVKISTLQDICVAEITKNIHQISGLDKAGISQTNTTKILKILSKNRSLNDSTLALFLNPHLKSLEFWDCSNVSSDSLNKIAAYCGNLEELTLFMCGQLHNDNLVYFMDKLVRLHKLALNGPFLISDTMWQKFFEQAMCPLTEFEIRNTHRFSNGALISLLERFGASLSSLKLSRLDGLDSASVYELIPKYLTKLTALEISYPNSPSLISDDLLIHILALTGESLVSLNVDGCSELSDDFLREGVAKFCPNLQDLSLKNLGNITDDGFASAFRELAEINTNGLRLVDLTRCIGLGDSAIDALFAHSAKSLVTLSLNSVNKLSKSFLQHVVTGPDTRHDCEGGFPVLAHLDVSFVRRFDDEVAESFGLNCPKLAILEVFGNNKISARASSKPSLLIIGRQGDDM